MGIDAALFVVKQFTDDSAWLAALDKISQTLSGRKKGEFTKEILSVDDDGNPDPVLGVGAVEWEDSPRRLQWMGEEWDERDLPILQDPAFSSSGNEGRTLDLSEVIAGPTLGGCPDRAYDLVRFMWLSERMIRVRGGDIAAAVWCGFSRLGGGRGESESERIEELGREMQWLRCALQELRAWFAAATKRADKGAAGHSIHCGLDDSWSNYTDGLCTKTIKHLQESGKYAAKDPTGASAAASGEAAALIESVRGALFAPLTGAERDSFLDYLRFYSAKVGRRNGAFSARSLKRFAVLTQVGKRLWVDIFPIPHSDYLSFNDEPQRLFQNLFETIEERLEQISAEHRVLTNLAPADVALVHRVCSARAEFFPIKQLPDDDHDEDDAPTEEQKNRQNLATVCTRTQAGGICIHNGVQLPFFGRFAKQIGCSLGGGGLEFWLGDSIFRRVLAPAFEETAGINGGRFMGDGDDLYAFSSTTENGNVTRRSQ